MDESGDAVRFDERGDEGLLGDLGLGFVGFEEGLDVGEAAGLGEAADRQFLDVAGGGRRGGGVIGGGEGGVDFERLVGVVYVSEALLSSGDVYDFGDGGVGVGSDGGGGG